VRYVDIVVVGGGPAGAATACGLAAIGREVLLIERSLGSHHKVCGEFISPETAAHLVQLGVNKLMRVGTCGGLQPDLSMGDLIIALSATPADSTATHYVLGEPHAPTADFGLVHEAVHQAKHLGKPVRVGPIVSSDIFYQPDSGLAGRWSERGILAVEMEAAILFTLGALRKIQAGCMLIVSDVVVEGEFVRITDEEMRAAVDQMTELALHVVTA